MAIGLTSLDSGADTANQPSKSSNVVTFPANQLLVAAVFNTKATNPPVPAVVSAASTGLTWVPVGTILFFTNATPLRRVSILRSMGAASTTSAVAFSGDGTNQTGWMWTLSAFSGVDTSGSNGSGAVRQPTTNFSDASVTSLTVTLGAFASSANGTFGAFGNDNNATSMTAGSGLALTTAPVTMITPNAQLATEWTLANDTTVNMTDTLGGATVWGGVAFEIVAAPLAGGPRPFVSQYSGRF